MPAPTLANWKKSRVGSATLPSGIVVKLDVPDLPELLREGKVPNDLVKYAVETEKALQGDEEEFDLEQIKEATNFIRWLVATTVTEPALTPEDVPQLPPLDSEMVLEFAMRRRQVDAVGHQLYGMEKIDAWRKFHFERI